MGPRDRGWPLAPFRIGFGLVSLFAFWGAGGVRGLNAWLAPALERGGPSVAGWARFLRLAA